MAKRQIISDLKHLKYVKGEKMDQNLDEFFKQDPNRKKPRRSDLEVVNGAIMATNMKLRRQSDLNFNFNLLSPDDALKHQNTTDKINHRD